MNLLQSQRAAVAALTLIGVHVGASSQQVYKCGSTYSQTPCDKGTETVKVYRDTPASPPPGLKGRDLCRRAVPNASNLKDPYSAVVEAVGDGKHDTVRVGNEPVVAKRFDVLMNAKNSYGAYTGAKLYQCYVSEDELRILRIQGPAQ